MLGKYIMSMRVLTSKYKHCAYVCVSACAHACTHTRAFLCAFGYRNSTSQKPSVQCSQPTLFPVPMETIAQC